ncbi:PilZ domain-containing protein [Idiomarina fontislapidosi]|uniref:PilZ domain-containing protein n=1 Tax=Idiomarina fontislapidosi TaxID=263723 RepID=A0A432YBQ5_9GAMM|nr:PilZ domain-containing protein [Idiomarina fontislapidosi]PYE35550.1 PilZ domain-containing protein [Idiomarina fontislapidosi]RUO58425.1 hypothetical protein CWE25_02210 [Idiomarina fontislapidosi]|tara:strand:- start:351 stop:632 length:282 start_codon:yes stop_codon:yes gene_type:complete
MHDDDKRSDRRVPIRTSAIVEVSGKTYHGECCDLSAHGVLLILPERLDVGVMFDIAVKAAGSTADLRATGIVVRVDDTGESGYEHGCKLIDVS